MWMDRFEFLRGEMAEMSEEGEGKEEMVVFPLVLHPDTSGMAHVLPMIERVVRWLMGFGEEVEFLTFGEVAGRWKDGGRRER